MNYEAFWNKVQSHKRKSLFCSYNFVVDRKNFLHFALKKSLNVFLYFYKKKKKMIDGFKYWNFAFGVKLINNESYVWINQFRAASIKFALLCK